ncbi:NAD(P)H-dependent oxidoreductase [Altererythrobacter sp.]|uniref:FMN-dependent NADH-azoreductase n=1 Tax=Altererythrobacter sp. TaxID=1872480 RepID=UPI001B295B5B|nr:NAD(P)H-dependent oxidoreductase [Altererythrobacter sp.]MBO6608710.1 NAD(P)H-dependent oxidoreductase [Altererythrobacter sp.]MBO6642965.1 NAD(P)H-dependent oxidoreductase [Altererythrobacter sp.]MBO6709708.1 NAD(P)H-dependent oxidoreductase [Altererythrobacter sp.]
MTNILHITASIRGEESVSKGLGIKLVEGLAAQHKASVTRRDLAQNDLPFIDADRFAANLAPHAERTPEQSELAAIADTLIEELQAADTIVFSTPIYNFGVPATVKAWADLVARAGTTFKYTENGPEGLLTGKKAYITAASGGTTVGSEIDFMTPWLKFFLSFLGITDVDVIAADGIMGAGGEEKIKQAHETVERLAA